MEKKKKKAGGGGVGEERGQAPSLPTEPISPALPELSALNPGGVPERIGSNGGFGSRASAGAGGVGDKGACHLLCACPWGRAPLTAAGLAGGQGDGDGGRRELLPKEWGAQGCSCCPPQGGSRLGLCCDAGEMERPAPCFPSR